MVEKKLPKGVYKRKDGRYEGRFMYHGESYAIYGGEPRKVKKQLDDLRYEVEHNMYEKPSKLTVDKWFDEWIEIYKKPNVKNSTIELKLRYYNLYIQKHIGKKYVADVMPKDIQKIFNEMSDNGYSNCTMTGVKAIMSEMFTQAYKEKLTKENPVEFTTVAKGRPRQKHPALTKQEQEIFAEYAKKYSGIYYDYYMVALCTGMRRGEVMALRWEDIDFKNKVIHVTGTLSRSLSDKLYRTVPKTTTSTRDIPMLESIYVLLKAHRRNQLQMKLTAGQKWKPIEGLEDLVFLGEKGTPRDGRNIARNITDIIKLIREDGYNIKNFSFHSFRHTFATRAIEGGMNPQTLKTILGHSGIEMTLDIYAHVMEDTKKEEMKLISDMF